jgi:transposase
LDHEAREETREFNTFDRSLKELVQWLVEHAVELVIMESTSVYWKRLYALLEQVSLKVFVVNARHIKAVPGRKTDVMDSQWLATIGRYGLARGSFIPPQDLRELRMLATYRMKLIGHLSGEKNRLHKLLDDAGIRLGNVVSDINGVSAKEMIQGLLDGQTIEQMSQCARGLLKKKIPDIQLALDCPLSLRHRYLLEQIHDHIVDLEHRVKKIDAYLLEAMKMGYQESWRLLQTIPGIDQIGAAIIIIVIGIDMSCFGSMQQLCSWAGMCPGNNESAGKRKSARTRKGNRLLRQLLCQVANAAAKTNCQFKSKYEGLVIRRGHKRAIIALGHKILRVVYTVLNNQRPYQDPEVDYTALVVQKNAPRWLKMLKQYGYLAVSK